MRISEKEQSPQAAEFRDWDLSLVTAPRGASSSSSSTSTAQVRAVLNFAPPRPTQPAHDESSMMQRRLMMVNKLKNPSVPRTEQRTWLRLSFKGWIIVLYVHNEILLW